MFLENINVNLIIKTLAIIDLYVNFIDSDVNYLKNLSLLSVS